LATLLGHFDEAEAHFAGALDVSQRLGFPYWIARTQIANARFLREIQQPHGAKGLLGNALQVAREHGFGALVEQAEALA
jgi:hypothetical protein